MHRDPSRDKCQALPFGSHKENEDWPAWVTVKSAIKVIGALFSNCESIDKWNSNLVPQCFYTTLNKSYCIKGTIMQKVCFVNTYLFSKPFVQSNVFIDICLCRNPIAEAVCISEQQLCFGGTWVGYTCNGTRTLQVWRG